jgi:hypothetical protein
MKIIFRFRFCIYLVVNNLQQNNQIFFFEKYKIKAPKTKKFQGLNLKMCMGVSITQ